MDGLVIVCTVVVVFAVAMQGALLAYDWRDRRAIHARIKAIRIPGPEVRVADLAAVDFEAPQPLVQVPHSHVWGAQPADQDTTSLTYRCQVPHCSRIHTVMR